MIKFGFGKCPDLDPTRRVLTSWCLPLKKPSDCQEDRYVFLKQQFEKNGWSNKFCHVKQHATKTTDYGMLQPLPLGDHPVPYFSLRNRNDTLAGELEAPAW